MSCLPFIASIVLGQHDLIMVSSVASNRTCGSAVVELIAVYQYSEVYVHIGKAISAEVVDYVCNHIIIMINVTILLLS